MIHRQDSAAEAKAAAEEDEAAREEAQVYPMNVATPL